MTEAAKVPSLLDVLRKPTTRMLACFHEAAWPGATLSEDSQLKPLSEGWTAAVESAEDEVRWAREKAHVSMIERVTHSDLVTLADCPIGLFLCGDTIALKTEYAKNSGLIEAYIVESGEFFWGEAPQTVEHQRATLVQPLSVGEVVNVEARPFPIGTAAGTPSEIAQRTERRIRYQFEALRAAREYKGALALSDNKLDRDACDRIVGIVLGALAEAARTRPSSGTGTSDA